MPTTSTLEILRKHIGKWVSLTDKEWEAMASRLKEKQFSKDQVYLSAGDVCRKIGFIIKGSTRMYYHIKGQQRCKDFQFEGGATGSIYSLTTGQPAKFSIAMLEDTTLLEITFEDLMDLYDNYKVWERWGRVYITAMFIYKENREASLLFNTSTQRYEALLREQPEHIKRIPLKHLASYLGVKPESLSRIRANLSKEGKSKTSTSHPRSATKSKDQN
jgi:CRP/FNR family transcriptional regulator, anaerobic regulatory protein